jgi:hypothetical protein
MSNEATPLLEQTPTINPYRNAAAEVLRRLKWDLQLESWASRAKLKAFHNIHKGEKAVILCNGPSLLKSDLTLLKGTRTFGLNKINMLFDKTDYRPDYIASVNPFVNEQNAEFFNTTSIPLFLRNDAMAHIKPRANVTFLYPAMQQKFARDCSMSIYEGFTVTYVALQLAYHMGFEQVALIGCDHNFAQTGAANKTVVSGEKDASHFDPNYFAGGVKWQLPDLLQSEVSYSMARDIFEGSGRRIYNCTEGGKLEVFQRRGLDEFLGKEK